MPECSEMIEKVQHNYQMLNIFNYIITVIGIIFIIVAYLIIYKRYDDYNQKDKNKETVDNMGPNITFSIGISCICLIGLISLIISYNI
jgi:heme/copper-type cytochrome/quinol oxidase subunit 2